MAGLSKNWQRFKGSWQLPSIFFCILSLSMSVSCQKKETKQANQAAPLEEEKTRTSQEEENNPTHQKQEEIVSSIQKVVEDQCQLSFKEHIDPIFKKHCFACHNSETQNGDLNLEAALSSAEWETSILAIENGSMPIGSSLSDLELSQLKVWQNMGYPLDSNNTTCEEVPIEVAGEDCEPQPFKEEVYPLSYQAYANSLTHYFASPDTPVPQDSSVSLFQTLSGGKFSETRFSVYQTMASEVAQKIVDDPLQYLNCSTIDRNCLSGFIDEWGPVLLRRNITPDKKALILAIYDQSIILEESASDSARVAIEKLLMSPSFIFRRQSAQAAEMSAVEVITELSLILKNRLPSKNEVQSYLSKQSVSEQELIEFVASVVESSQDSARSSFIDLFLGRIFYLHEMNGISKSSSFSDFNDQTMQAMQTELALYLKHSFFEQDDLFKALFTSNFSFINQDLNFIYKTSNSSSVHEKTVFPESERVGVLSLAAINTKFATSDKTDPVHRGLFIRNNLFCIPPGDVPVDFDATVPEGVVINTRREEIEYITSAPSCQVCHEKINGASFGLERFNAIGQIQKNENGYAIDSSGEIIGTQSTDGKFSSMADLGLLLAGSKDIQRCFAEHLVQFVYQRKEQDKCLQKKYAEHIQGRSNNFRVVLKEILSSEFFRKRQP